MEYLNHGRSLLIALAALKNQEHHLPKKRNVVKIMMVVHLIHQRNYWAKNQSCLGKLILPTLQVTSGAIILAG
jgi:hypothetical protein